MSTFFRRSFVLSAALLVLSSLVVYAAITDSAVHAPPDYDTFVPPAVGASYADPVFGTSVKRLSDAMTMTDNAGTRRPHCRSAPSTRPRPRSTATGAG